MTSKPVVTSGRTLDYAAGVYDILSPLMTFGQERRYARKAIALLDLQGHESVLDIGCGTGTLTIQLAKLLNPAGSLAVGLDAAPRMLEVARRKSVALGNIRFDHGVAEDLPYPDQTFDRAVSTFFFHHINFDLKQRALRELHRVLKEPASAVIVDVDVPTHWFGRLCAWSGYVLFRQDEIRENIRGQLREAFAASPFAAWRRVSTHMGYISIFQLFKGRPSQ